MTTGGDVQTDIVDAHHHLWDRSRHPQPWIDPQSMGAIDADFGPADLAAATRAAGVTQTVVVQAIHSAAETADLLDTAANSDLIAGVVGWVDVTADDAPQAIQKLATGGNLVGIRHVVQNEPDPAFLDRTAVRRAVAATADAGIVFDLVIRHHQIPAATRLAADLPQVSFVLDHLGKPPLVDRDLGDWVSDLRAMARLPNVTAKLSGLATEADWQSWTRRDVEPAVMHALDVFGPERLMFGSDWPVSLLATGYQRWIDVLAELLSECSESERRAIWHQTARRTYRLPPPPA
ncbi:amidohydrolase family protein [Micromonospora sp. PLK6-60]|uniref:amidohydrolase family protein n=1 Tax=Micromonospora sp. PLK6-60 TaxID=2873383 RepID=UPI001CA64FA1|nr:amidohydrolase family protein [Micromonospora sp. PLK6-60]MBY8875023.1 amidohydrolase family protein [Micromonospora sp. PLK6-60]